MKIDKWKGIIKYLAYFSYKNCIQTLTKLRIEGNFLNMLKNICTNPTTNIVLNDEKVEALLPRSSTRKVVPFSPLLFNTILEIAANALWQEKEMKGIQMGMQKMKLSLFTHDMIFYVEKSKESTKVLTEW